MQGSLERELISSIPALVFAKDLPGRYVLLNRNAAKTFGSRVGMFDSDVFRPDQVALLREQDEEVTTEGRPLEYHHSLWYDGRSLEYLTIKFPLRDDEGRIKGVGGFAADITTLRQQEGRAIEAWRAAAQASEWKTDLMAEVGHELRTPLQSILGYTQLLLTLVHGSEEARATATIARAGQHLLALTDELLETAQDERLSRFETAPVDPCSLVDEVIEMIRPLASAREMTLGRDVHDGLGAWVKADRRRLKQVLINLLGNAVRYGSSPGEVMVVLQDAAAGRLRFVVVDSGAGVRPEHAERLFAPYDRLDRDDDSEGSGLGLALSRSFIEAMGGAIGLDPDSGGFYVELDQIEAPAGAAQALAFDGGEPATIAPRPDVSGRILYVEDSGELARLVGDGLGRLLPSVELVHAPSGEAGLARLAAERFDLVLLDLRLPDVSGIQLLRQLRAQPVIAISGLATAATSEQLRALGAIDHLTKPIDLARLQQAVAGVLGETVEL